MSCSAGLRSSVHGLVVGSSHPQGKHSSRAIRVPMRMEVDGISRPSTYSKHECSAPFSLHVKYKQEKRRHIPGSARQASRERRERGRLVVSATMHFVSMQAERGRRTQGRHATPQTLDTLDMLGTCAGSKGTWAEGGQPKRKNPTAGASPMSVGPGEQYGHTVSMAPCLRAHLSPSDRCRCR